MYNGNVIRTMLAERQLQNKELLCYLGTEANSSLIQIIEGNPTVKRLEKVADFFGCSMDVFFKRENGYKIIETQAPNKEEQLLEKVALLERLLEEKDRRIELLESINQMLTSSPK